ncbi:MAG: hypothetical protein DI535_18970 [Citrobacter freundii]|nr:MAG: hypothetical protein DI535_18970 [Citrobacter freundii]
MLNRYISLILGICLCTCAYTQDDTTLSSALSGKYIQQVGDKAADLQAKLDKRSRRILRAFQKEEEKLQHKLQRKDSSAAATVFANAGKEYEQLQQRLSSGGALQQYIPSLDTLNSSLKFLQQNPQLAGLTKDGPAKLKNAVAKMTGLESEFRKAEEIKRFLKERKQYLSDQLSHLNMAGDLKKLNKQTYYYSAQINEYKQVLKDHKKAEQKALELLSKTKLFKDFMQKNSVLASLFRLPGDPNTSPAASLAGLQTRAQVNNLVQQQLAAGGPSAQAQFSQNMQDAQSKLNELKNKLSNLGNSSGGDLDMPDGFKPNNQRTKTFLQRIELGANIQSQKSNSYFPVTSDIALTAGYKLNDNSIIGIGAGYKLGWGRNIRNVKITHEGVSLRSFVDIKLKGSFWITGGYELNYRETFNRIDVLLDKSAWQESGLIGLSKVVDMRSKLLKKTKVQLLWDFLSYRQMPKPAAVQFRIGYSF